MIVKGKITIIPNFLDKPDITVHFAVDELMKNNTPHVNFWTFCLLNDLLREEMDEKNNVVYYPKINLAELQLSKDEEKNQKVLGMFNKYKVLTKTYTESA